MVYVNARAIIERSTADRGVEILLQTRVKPGQARQLELPGGQVEPFESLLEALCREVREETGLEVIELHGRSGRVVASGGQARVECVAPFAVYQTLDGPVPSMGVYFRCVAQGQLRAQAGESAVAGWFTPAQVRAMIDRDVEQVSWVDRAGIIFYLDAIGTPP